MAAFEVTASTLRSKKQELQQLNAQFKSKVSDLTQAQSKLSSTWEGEARNAFDNAYRTDAAKFDTFYQTVEDYCNRLETIISRYEQAEAKNVTTASSRTS